MRIMEKVGGIAGPLLGGIVGTVFGAEFIFLVAASVLLASLWPLFQTREPTMTHQDLHFRNFPWRRVKREFVAWTAASVDTTLSVNLWPLYLSLFALSGSVYAQLGLLTSFSVLVSITSAYVIGRLIDIRIARKVLRFSAFANALLYAVRPLVGSLWPAFGVSVTNEIFATGYMLPLTKGLYADIDEQRGLRITYIVVLETVGSITKGLAWIILTIGAVVLSTKSVIILGFIGAALASVLIIVERFKTLNPGRSILKA